MLISDIIRYPAVKQITKSNFNPKDFDKQLPDILVGLEVEVENAGHHPEDIFWEVVADGSLRNDGIEFRTSAFSARAVERVVNKLYANLKAYSPNHKFTERTSMHVHVDFRHRTFADLLKLHLVYAMFERAMFNCFAPDRYQSSFCVPLGTCAQTEYFGKVMADHLYQPDFTKYTLSKFVSQAAPEKYAALNLTNLTSPKGQGGDGLRDAQHRGCGSLEFRHLGGSDNPAKLISWVKLLALLVDYAGNAKPEEIVENIHTLNTTSDYTKYAERVFLHMSRHVIPVPFNVQTFSEGVSLAKEMLAPPRKEMEARRILPSPLLQVLQDRLHSQKEEHKPNKPVIAPQPGFIAFDPDAAEQRFLNAAERIRAGGRR